MSLEDWKNNGWLKEHRTLQALPLILGSDKKADAAYLDACRVKRNTAEYDMAGVATTADVDELIHFAEGLLDEVETWLARQHPDLKAQGR
jgi:hypothetical protein